VINRDAAGFPAASRPRQRSVDFIAVPAKDAEAAKRF
jgi:hypothetical protein